MKIIERPNLTFYEGVKITKDLKLEFKNKEKTQKVDNLVLTTNVIKSDPLYQMETTTNVYLEEGKYLIFDEEDGYIYPLNEACTLEEAIKEMKSLNDSLDKEE